jgi:DNA-binding LacI/PurR family transcriptional regulator
MQKTLLYKSITQDILETIEKGKLKPGDKIPSVKELCSSYDVSHVTALRVFRELSNSNHIMQKNGHQGYFVCSQSAVVNSVATSTIGCIIRPLREIRETDNYFNEIICGIQKEAYNKRYDLLSSHLSAIFNKFHLADHVQSDILETVRGMAPKVDGFLMDELIPDMIIREVMKITRKPIVIVNRTSSLEVDTVSSADKDGISDLFDAAWRMGYNKFIYCTSGYATENELARFEAFNAMVKKHKIPAENWGVVKDFAKNSLEDTLSVMMEMYEKLKENGKVLLMTPSDEIARTCIEPLAEKKIKIPSDLGITGFYGTGFAYYRKPELATIRIPAEDVGAQAVDVLVEKILNRDYMAAKKLAVKGNLSLGESI